MFQVPGCSRYILIIWLYWCIYFYRSYLHAYTTFNLRAVTSFKIASLHLVIACRNALKEEVQNESCIRVLVAMPFLLDFRLLPSSRTDTVGHFWAPWNTLSPRCPSRNFTRTCPLLLRLRANESNAAIFCSGKAGWARRPGTLRQEVFLFLQWKRRIAYYVTLPETNIAPENWWLEDYFRFGKANFQGLFLF